MEKSKNPRPFRKRVLLSVAALLGIWLVLELVALGVFRLSKPSPGGDLTSLYEQHPYRVYMLVPGVRSSDGRMSVNSQGFRGHEIALMKAPGVLRIACFGASTTFNDTASTDSHTYPAWMERFLRKHYERDKAIKGVEVINAGTPGYTSLESLIYLESKVLDYNLDLAVFHHAVNDAIFMTDFRDFASDYVHARKIFYVPKPALWERSAFLSLLIPGRRTLGNPHRVNRNLELAQLTLTDPDRLKITEDEQRRCFKPERIDIFDRNMRNFVYVARGHGVAPVLSTMAYSEKMGFLGEVIGRINDRIRTTAADLDVPCIDYAKQMPWSTEAFADLCHLKDGPNGLERKGKVFAEFLVRNGLLERLAAADKPDGSSQP